MAINFDTLLTKEQKLNFLNSRIEGFISEAYDHELNRLAAVKNGDADLEQKSVEALDILENVIITHQDLIVEVEAEV